MKTNRLLACLLAALCLATPLYAQDQELDPLSDGRFHFTIAPYFLAPSMNGDVTIRGKDLEVGIGPTEIFDNLKFGIMGYVEVRKNRWAFAFDGLYMNLERGAEFDTVLGTVGARVSMRQGMYEFTGAYRTAPWLGAIGGFRINHLSLQYETVLLGLSDDQSKPWADPFVGVRLRVPDAGRWLLALRADLGGFGIGSDFAWQVYGMGGHAFTELFTFAAGYRYLKMKYATGEGGNVFVYDMAISGPFVGFVLKF